MKKVKIISIIIMILCIGIVVYMLLRENKITDAEKFSKEYTLVDKSNKFEYKTIDEIINILKNGTGIVYLGFPSCPWCQKYVTYLNDVSKDLKLNSIYYFDIYNDRKENTKNYQEIVNILTDYLQYNDEGKKRVYVPSVIAVNKGKIVGFDDETAWDTGGFDNPNDYWTEEKVTNLKEKLVTMINKANTKVCTSCND